MNKQSILDEFTANFFAGRKLENGGLVSGCLADDEIKEWLSSALSRYAMSVVEQSVPAKQPMMHMYEPLDNYAHNCCRNATLNKAREITHSEEK